MSVPMRAGAAAALVLLALPLVSASRAQDVACPGGLREAAVGVAVVPPNVLHTPAYVAKELGLFARHCIDAKIVAFEGAGSATATVAVAQGKVIGTISDVAIAQGVKAHQIFMYAPRLPQLYAVSGQIKTPADLKGKRLSAAGGGVGSFNWRMARAVLTEAGLKPEDVQFISQGTAGRLPGLLTGQLDGVVLHPEDFFIAQRQRPDVHVLSVLAEKLPHMPSGAYGAADTLIGRDRITVVAVVAAMVEANRTIYRDKARVLPIIAKMTEKPLDAVEYALDVLTKNCIWAVNSGFAPERTTWTLAYNLENGDIQKDKAPTYAQIVDETIAAEAIAKVGGAVEIGGCRL